MVRSHWWIHYILHSGNRCEDVKYIEFHCCWIHRFVRLCTQEPISTINWDEEKKTIELVLNFDWPYFVSAYICRVAANMFDITSAFYFAVVHGMCGTHDKNNQKYPWNKISKKLNHSLVVTKKQWRQCIKIPLFCRNQVKI